MAREISGREIISGGLGVLAFALGAGAIRGVVQPAADGAIDSAVPALAILAVLAGVVGLYLGHTRGIGRQLAVVGTGVAIIGLALFGGSIALDLLLDASTT
jgi:hypothetical protein